MNRFSHQLLRTAVATGAALALAACGGSDGPSAPAKPSAPLGLTATAISSSSIRVTFNSTAGDNSYVVERAEGSGTFAQAGSVTAPATAGAVTFADANLKRETLYRYRVKAQRGAQESDYTSETAATTLAFGSAAKDITADITANTTFYADTAYTLKGFIHVTNGATLTIQPGTTIKGDYATLGSSLFVMRGAKIQAVGTADAPIVFTSSRGIGQRSPGDWGGLIIIGNARSSRDGDVEVEGTGTDGTTVASGKNYRVLYSGGTNDADTSGELKYVRVEFAGFAPSVNNELNSFTFAAIGSGTKLSYLESLSGLDDSFEFFGGTVDASYLVSYESGDDHYDMSEGFRGRLQYLVAYQSTVLTPRTGAGSVSADPQGIENDGCNGTGCTNGFDQAPFTTPVVANYSLVGTGDASTSGASGGIGMMLRRGTGGYYVNGVLARWPRSAIAVRDAETYKRAGNVTIPDVATADLALRNILIASSGTTFEAGTARFAFDVAGNALTVSPTLAITDLFTAIPDVASPNITAASFDWTPKAASAAAAGGLATFTGKLATAAGAAVTGTPYLGAAAPGGTKWWQGWTYYARQ
ncbi:MAG: fibronectin type III domain-containing protein [Gemmatimonadaceae bacterium]